MRTPLNQSNEYKQLIFIMHTSNTSFKSGFADQIIIHHTIRCFANHTETSQLNPTTATKNLVHKPD